jgi:hypothetical protein
LQVVSPSHKTAQSIVPLPALAPDTAIEEQEGLVLGGTRVLKKGTPFSRKLALATLCLAATTANGASNGPSFMSPGKLCKIPLPNPFLVSRVAGRDDRPIVDQIEATSPRDIDEDAINECIVASTGMIARKAWKAALKSCCLGAVSAGSFTLAILCTMTYQPASASAWSALSVCGNTSYLVSCGTGIGAACQLCVAAGAVIEGVAACVSKNDGDGLEKIE